MTQVLKHPADPPRTPWDARSCANCGAVPGGRYCGECGQPTITGPLTVARLVRELIADTANLERGFLFTLRQMTVRPATAIDEYLAGRTIPFVSPQKYLFVAGAISTLLLLMLGRTGDLSGFSSANFSAPASPLAEHASQVLVSLIWDHYNLLILASIPIATAASWLLFRPARRTFAEHLVFNSYTFAHQALLFAALTLVLWASSARPEFHTLAVLLITGYWVWAATRFFRLRWWDGLLRGVGATLLFSTTYMVVLVAGIILYAWWISPSG